MKTIMAELSSVLSIESQQFDEEDTEGENEEAKIFAQAILGVRENTIEELSESIITGVSGIIVIPDNIRPSFKLKGIVPGSEREQPPVRSTKVKIIPSVDKDEEKFPDIIIDEQKNLTRVINNILFSDAQKQLKMQIILNLREKMKESGRKIASVEELVVVASIIVNKNLYGCKYSPDVENRVKIALGIK